MGAYAYCRKCDAGLDRPTLREAVLGERERCVCGHVNELSYPKEELAQYLTDFEERLIAVEKHLNLSPKED
jgi:hypothetical protein